MHIINKNHESPNQLMLWSSCLLVAAAFVIADVLSGGFNRETVMWSAPMYGVVVLGAIARFGVFQTDGPPGARFIRSYSRHKL